MEEVKASNNSVRSQGNCRCGCSCEPNRDHNSDHETAADSQRHLGPGCMCSCLFSDDRNNQYEDTRANHQAGE